MANNLVLYGIPESGPCRTVLWAAKLLGIELNLKHIDLFKGEQLQPEFLKLNPQHAVPTLTDGDFALAESRAIIIYLAEKYGKNDSFYPKDLKKRAIINQRLFFDINTLALPVTLYYRGIYFGSKTYDESKMPDIQKGFEFLNTFLSKSKYAAGETFTLADVALVSTVATAIAVYDFDLKPYPNVQKWFNDIKATQSGYKTIIEENGQKLRAMVDGAKAKNNA